MLLCQFSLFLLGCVTSVPPAHILHLGTALRQRRAGGPHFRQKTTERVLLWGTLPLFARLAHNVYKHNINIMTSAERACTLLLSFSENKTGCPRKLSLSCRRANTVINQASNSPVTVAHGLYKHRPFIARPRTRLRQRQNSRPMPLTNIPRDHSSSIATTFALCTFPTVSVKLPLPLLSSPLGTLPPCPPNLHNSLNPRSYTPSTSSCHPPLI